MGLATNIIFGHLALAFGEVVPLRLYILRPGPLPAITTGLLFHSFSSSFVLLVGKLVSCRGLLPPGAAT
jgi:hypothetical protein